MGRRTRQMTQASPPNQAANPGRGKSSAAVLVGLALVAILSLGFAGYMALNHNAVTVTQQQFVTNTQSLFLVQTQTLTTANTVMGVTTVTNSQPSGSGYGNYQSCGYYGCYPSYGNYPGYYYNYPGYYGYYNSGYYNGYYRGYYVQSPACQPAGNYGNVTCSGYLYQANNGCTLLAVSTTSNPYPSYATGDVIEYYTLQHLPSSTPQPGSWITVNGQLYQGYNTASNGASCPTNYIVVSSIS